jgi:hypothetical protein
MAEATTSLLGLYLGSCVWTLVRIVTVKLEAQDFDVWCGLL